MIGFKDTNFILLKYFLDLKRRNDLKTHYLFKILMLSNNLSHIDSKANKSRHFRPFLVTSLKWLNYN